MFLTCPLKQHHFQRENLVGLKELGDEFFAQLEPLLADDDLRN